MNRYIHVHRFEFRWGVKVQFYCFLMHNSPKKLWGVKWDFEIGGGGTPPVPPPPIHMYVNRINKMKNLNLKVQMVSLKPLPKVT